MATDTDPEATAMGSPEAAFSVLGDETRLTILQTLGETEEPLGFSALFDRVEYDDPSNFNYHLKKLTGHFVLKDDDGYVLRQAGRRVIEAVLAEAMADDTELSRTEVDVSCFRCGAPIEIRYRQAHLGEYCSECGGTRDGSSPTTDGRVVESADLLGVLDLPPAGVTNRTPNAVLQTARFWTTGEAHALSRDTCPRCAAPVDHSLDVCSDHDPATGHCEACGQRFAVVLHHNCTNCIYGVTSPVGTYLLDTTELIEFLLDHDVDPLALPGFHLSALTETVLSTDPFSARFTFTAGDDSITLTVDHDLSVVDVTRSGGSDRSHG